MHTCLLAHNLLYNSFLFQIAYAHGAAVLIIRDLDWICFRIVVNLVLIYVGNIGSSDSNSVISFSIPYSGNFGLYV